MRFARSVLVAAVAFAWGCASEAASPTNPVVVVVPGQFLFTHTGGSFSASGPAYTAANPTATYVAAQLDAADGMFYALASLVKAANTRDFAIVAFNRTTPGNSTIDGSCSGSNCAMALFVFGQNQSTGGYAQLCLLTAGTFTIATLTATRATGTFSGTGTCSASGGSPTSFTVTGGTFDADLVNDTPDTAPSKSGP